MNYYEHHIGDYAKATSHLTFVEDAAYSRLIRKYYDIEAPLPAELAAVQRLVGARTREEKSAVRTVLEEFFFLDQDGWHNKRADEEIAKFHAKSLKARESANARWMRTHSERIANAQPTQSEGNALQSPVTSHQSPKEREGEKPAPAKPARVARATSLPDDFALTDQLINYAKLKYVDHTVEFESFKNWHLAKGSTYKNWDAAWRSWVDKAAKYRQNNPPRQSQMTPYQQSIKAASISIFGNLEGNQNDQRIIDVTPEATAGLLGSQDLR